MAVTSKSALLTHIQTPRFAVPSRGGQAEEPGYQGPKGGGGGTNMIGAIKPSERIKIIFFFYLFFDLAFQKINYAFNVQLSNL